MLLSFSSEKNTDRGYFSGVQPLDFPPRLVSVAALLETDSGFLKQGNDFSLFAVIVSGIERLSTRVRGGFQSVSGLPEHQHFVK